MKSLIVVIGTARSAVMEHDSELEAMRSGVRLALMSTEHLITMIDKSGETRFVSTPLPVAAVVREPNALTT